jgi:hypothetical protein
VIINNLIHVTCMTIMDSDLRASQSRAGIQESSHHPESAYRVVTPHSYLSHAALGRMIMCTQADHH